MSLLMGYGSVRFVYSPAVGDDIDIEFTGGVSTPTYIPIQESILNDDDSLITRLHGYRVELNTHELYNLICNGADITKYQQLASILTALVDPSQQNTVTIYPRYDSGYSNLSYTCVLDSNITFEDIARVEAGQMINLDWKVVDKVTNIPTFIHTTADTYVDDDLGTNDYWDGTDTYVDE